MIRRSLLSTLLVSTALLLTSCDDEGGGNVVAPTTEGLAYNAEYDIPPTPTMAGNFLAGQFAQNRSDWKSATDFFDTVLKFAPDSTDTKRRILALSLGAGEFDRSIKIAEELSKKSDNDATLANLVLCLRAFKNKDYDYVIENAKTDQKDGLSVAIIPILKSWAEAAKGKTDIISLNHSPSLLYQTVLIAAYNKDAKAIETIAAQNDFVKTPTPIGRFDTIADIFAAYDQRDEALQIYSALQQAFPKDAAKYDAKIKGLQGATSLPIPERNTTPQIEFSNALLDMARLLANGYEDSARLFAQMSIYLLPTNSDAIELLSQIAARNGLYTEAIDHLAQIDTKGAPEKDIQIKRQISALLHESGKDDEAIRILQSLVKDTNNVEAQIQIGDIYRNAENFSDALSAYNAAFKILGDKVPENYWDLIFARGITHERLKNWDKAEKDFQDALSYEPDQPYILNYLAYSWADQGKNLDKASEMLEKAVRLKPDDGAIVDSLGWVYYRMGQYEKAVKILEQAVELLPTEPEINDHLGDAYWQVGRKSEARFQWKRTMSFTTEQNLISALEKKLSNGLTSESSAPVTEKYVDSRS